MRDAGKRGLTFGKKQRVKMPTFEDDESEQVGSLKIECSDE